MTVPAYRLLLILALPMASLLSDASLAASEALSEDTTPNPNSLMGEDLPSRMSYDINDLRIGVTIAAVPDIHETVHTSGGTAYYTWNGHRTTGGGPDLSYITQPAPGTRFWRHLLVGAEIQYLYLNDTPTSYTVGSTTAPNTTSQALALQMLNVDVLAGWCSAPAHTSWGDIDVELLGFIGGGFLWGDTEGNNPNGQPVLARGVGLSNNDGARLGAVIERDHWLTGLHIDYVYTNGHINVNLPNGDHSRLSERRLAPAATFEIGYRF